MKYPRINKQSRREVAIPQLSGGLNLRDSLTNIRDNQLTDCVNMWYKDGMLKTRPCFECDEGTPNMIAVNKGYKITNKKVHSDIKKDGAVLISIVLSDMDTDDTRIAFVWQSDKEQVLAGNMITLASSKNSYFVVECKGIIYCYISDFSIYKFDYKNDASDWKKVLSDEYYMPTVLAHAKALNNGLAYAGTMFEGYNLLTDSYRMIYSAVNLEEVVDGETWMRYPYLSKLPDNIDTTIIARLTNKDGTVCEHKAVWTGGKELRCFETVDKEPEDGLYLYVTARHVHFVTEMGTSKIATISKEDYVEDNLEIKVIYSANSTNEKFKKIFNMTQSIWFGGAANGIKGGSRLFLCGNTMEDEKALVLWSALNNPLYFNENNYVYVGNKAQPVTAFGKQGEKLVIFKPEEMYYTYYVANDNIEAQNLIDQTIVDYEAGSVIFPIISLHSQIGCDCPNTIELCRNRLVWLNSNGRVYTLVSANQYSEMTVYTVSELVHNELKNYSEDQLKKANSQDFGGHYMLILDSDAYLMDYNSYGYTHISGYAKNEDANALIPWYYWTLLSDSYFVNEDVLIDSKPSYCIIGDNIMAIYECRPHESYYCLKFSKLNIKNKSDVDSLVLYDKYKTAMMQTKPIYSKMQTKLFDFSAAGYLKNIDRVSVEFGNNGGNQICLTYVTNDGAQSDNVTIVDGSTDERDAEFVAVENFYPSLRAVRIFGLKIECEGQQCINGLTIQYRVLGGVK